jgi:hypothetical protein
LKSDGRQRAFWKTRLASILALAKVSQDSKASYEALMGKFTSAPLSKVSIVLSLTPLLFLGVLVSYIFTFEVVFYLSSCLY